MVDRTRKIINKPATWVNIEYLTLEAAVTELQGLIKSYGHDAVIQIYTPLESGNKYLQVYANLPESDDEMNLRIASEELEELTKHS